MQEATGIVVTGKVVVEDDALEEGAVAAVVRRRADERFSLTEAQEEEHAEALPETERGAFVTLEDRLRSLAGNG